MSLTRLHVAGPVVADVGPIEVRFHHFDDHRGPGPDDGYEKPWAVGGICRVTFRFAPDGLRITKRLSAWHRWQGTWGTPRSEKPTTAEVADAQAAVATEIRRLLTRHGIDPSTVPVVLSDDVKPSLVPVIEPWGF